MQATTTVARSGETFDALVSAMQAHFAAVLAAHGPHLFRVETDTDLYERYLDTLECPAPGAASAAGGSAAAPA